MIDNKNLKLFLLWAGFLLCLVLAGIIIFGYKIQGHHFDEEVFNFTEKKRIVVAFRNDDLSVESDLVHEAAVLALFKKYGIKQTFGFIPKTAHTEEQLSIPHEKRVPIVHALKGWEKKGYIDLALHGYTHMKGPKTGGEFGGLSFEEQNRRIGDGIRIVNQLFNINVDTFIPPFNQADNNTYSACIDSDIHWFSGFWGEGDAGGLPSVNGNASLFSSDYYKGANKSQNLIPSAEEVLNFLESPKGTAFLIIFYHSKSDFDNKNNFIYLDSFLAKLKKHPFVEISTIKRIPELYTDALSAYNSANRHIYSAICTKNLAKPYLMVLEMFLADKVPAELVDEQLYQGINAYWQGNYRKATTISSISIKKSNRYIIIGRSLAFGLFLVVSLFFLSFKKNNTNDKQIKMISSLRLVYFTSPFLIWIYIFYFSPFSTVRIDQFNGLLVLFSFGAIIAFLISRLIRIKK
ncbi:hypothetical protein DSCO28_33190 [Desulfosarcina ovata subsp. sediminis]|uniref:NodB homology domain-containing protein n=1 Tax=Desulfosarcina ovata subsp. sediminis TaxID=885957 RepID=A0A5K7ZRT6_9BACT|nr:DUF2334 domain-containing protein [Desulfosarcina ovata]BBO82753.1 hypothetical protein DSCO28_33190 [Desulfosarcina ovata subsp. sediminis]